MTGSDFEGFSAESEHDHAACLSHALAQVERYAMRTLRDFVHQSRVRKMVVLDPPDVQ